MIIQRLVPVRSREEIAEGLFVLTVESTEFAGSALPGQFVNVRPAEGSIPLLRRPFSISRVKNEKFELVFNVIGGGTRLLALKQPGEMLDVLGPLGKPFRYKGDFETALIVAGGIGVAPFPFLTDFLKQEGKKVVTFLGARTAAQLLTQHLENVQIATDDGTNGFHGTVVTLLEGYLQSHSIAKPKIFGCGPTRMLKALSDFAQKAGIECELSLEGDMACGVGLCQGCPVERTNGAKKYALVCTEGPIFNCHDIILR